jgi:biotin synthase
MPLNLNYSEIPERAGAIRHDWSRAEAGEFFALPLNDLIYKAHALHRQFFDPNEIQLSSLLNIKEGGCAEDCGYCPQSAHYETGVEPGPTMGLDAVISAARQAKSQGASRFCMGGAWRSPRARDFEKVLAMVQAVSAEGMETCATLGMLSESQARQLKTAGLDYYNHNLDTSPEFYQNIITTRTYADRLQTLEHVRNAGINVCCGGIVGMGEDTRDRVGLLVTLANLPKHPESVPINLLIRIEGTPLADAAELDPFDLVRTVAVARILMPASYVRLSAGRTHMTDATQALCFFAGANSIFQGDKLLTADNPAHDADQRLFQRLGLHAKAGIDS